MFSTTTVQSGDEDTNGITLTSPIELNGGTIQDASLNDAELAFTPQSNSVLVDGVAPVADSITPPANGSYFTDENLDFVVLFDGNVNVAGTPVLPFTIGSTTRNASYVSGNGTNTLTFRYTIQSADQDVDGITVDPATISGAGITDAAGNEADFSPAPTPSTAAVIVNAAVIDSVTASADCDYEVGDTITLTANFSQSVNVLGTPSIGLTVGSTPQSALYTSGTGTTILTFEYQVQVGDLDADGIDVATPVNLNGGTIRDAAGNDAVLSFTPITNGVFISNGRTTKCRRQ